MSLANISIDPQTIYDQTHSYQNANDRVSWERSIAEGPMERQKMGMALITADPGVPNSYIQANYTADKIPPRFGYGTEEPGIMEVAELTDNENFGHAADMKPTDFSGQPQAENKASSYPSLPVF